MKIKIKLYVDYKMRNRCEMSVERCSIVVGEESFLIRTLIKK